MSLKRYKHLLIINYIAMGFASLRREYALRSTPRHAASVAYHFFWIKGLWEPVFELSMSRKAMKVTGVRSKV